MSRGLRPGFLVPSGERLWAVDWFQPVAAVLDPASGTVERVVSWPELPPPDAVRARVFGSDSGVWVQPCAGGPVALIGSEGLVRAGYSAGLRLAGVTEAGAWCGPSPNRSPRRLVQRPPEPEDVLCIQPDGTARRVTVDRPVGELRTTSEGLYVRVDADPWNPGRLEDAGHEPVWLHLPADASPPERLTRADHGDADPPPRPAPMLPGNPGPGGWHFPAEVPGREDAVAGGLRWVVGWADGHRTDPPVLATGHDPSSGDERQRVLLGNGQAVALAAWGDFLWVALRRTRRKIPDRDAAVELLRVDARTGQARTVLPAESLDIAEHCRPLPPEPVDADSYAEYQRSSFDGLASYAAELRRAPSTEAGHAYGEGLTSCRAELAGHWPGTAIRLRCTHSRFPGLELVRVLPLFDELGRQSFPENAAAALLEDLETGAIPPADRAENGVLHI